MGWQTTGEPGDKNSKGLTWRALKPVSEVETELKQERHAVFYVHQLCFEASAIEKK